MKAFNLVAQSNESTVIAEFEPVRERSDRYQSEAELESQFIRDLTEQGYTYLNIKSEDELVANLRTQLELLNDYRFSDNEWKTFFKQNIANENEGILEKTKKVQFDYVQVLTKDDGSTKNIYLLNKKNIHANRLQVINQYEEKSGTHHTRYDVTILVNGLPMIHIELKRRGVAIREAFNQIKRYQRDSFWAGSGLFEYVQLFVISNGTHTKYYSNTTRDRHIKEFASPGSAQRQTKKTSNSFEFTSYWADGNNRIINDLRDFTKTFFARHAILNILTRYCVFTTENALLVMRPYQIAATERILNKIEISSNYKLEGSIDAGGYIWHTTGSGKTLTSFKTAQLASNLPFIDKVLFVVDRKDLDYQTMKEYDKFEKGAANSNSSTKILQRQLEDSESKIIITTIQKLGNFIKKNPKHNVFNKHLVMIFDECHRSQFGELHSQIVKNFKKYHLFGFTGTPIFAANASHSGRPDLKTTVQAFGQQLHTYTIVDAIRDQNVLPFRIDYIDTVKAKDDIEDKKVTSIDREAVMMDPRRIELVTKYILDHFDQKTKRSESYTVKGKRLIGFNSIMAVSSIEAAMAYYVEFKKQTAKGKKISVATIFSFGANEDDPEDKSGTLPEEGFETELLNKTSRDFLEAAISDYNKMFHTNFDTSADKFQNYYKDLSMRMKNREVDLVIVVNMFLTGFDATTLNTLWVDKNLRMHGLIQAFSRTNRILNSVKNFGNIVCFRPLKTATDEAIAQFGNKEARGLVLLKSFSDYFDGYTDDNGKYHKGYRELVEELKEKFPVGEEIVGEANVKEFILLYGSILRARNILTAFDEFEALDPLSERDRQDYQSQYLDNYIKREKSEKERINDDVVFEIELVQQDAVNIDYILRIIEKHKKDLIGDQEVILSIRKAIDSSPELRSKKELIESFIQSVSSETQVTEEWIKHVKESQEKELDEIIKEERLKEDKTRKFIENAFRDGVLSTTGTAIDEILPPVPIFPIKGQTNRAKIRKLVVERLKAFFEKYFGLGK